MTKTPRKAIVISASSDIGAELCKKWRQDGWDICGTYRTPSPLVQELTNNYGIKMVKCDLLDKNSIRTACRQLKEGCLHWDVLVFAPGRQEPVGDFHHVSFDEWEEGVQVNLLAQLRILRDLLFLRNPDSNPEPCVLFFAGGGTNNAVVHYSSYTMCKIALIKMCELLDAEIPDTRFVIVGPGWVKTKIHQPTLEGGAKLAGDNYEKTIDKLKSNECTPMDKVIDCCDWVVNTPSKGVRGRNFSVVFDRWGSPDIERELEKNRDMYKLRRHGNDWKGRES